MYALEAADSQPPTQEMPQLGHQRRSGRLRWIASWLLKILVVFGVTVGFLGVVLRWWDVRLTSNWVVGILAILAVAAMAAASGLWDRVKWRRTRRFGLLLAVQVLTAATLAAGANLAGGFYGTLGELLGVRHAGPGTVLPATDHGNPGTQPSEVPLEPWLAQARKATGKGKGVWAQLSISGRRTGYQLPAWAYVPDAYFDSSQPARRFPTVILLAGFPGDVENWEKQGHMVHILDQLMAEGKIPPMILVSVTQNPVAGKDSECVDAVGGAKADTYISEDIPETLAEHLRVQNDRTAWSLMGYSTGGYCAIDLALRHPQRFASAVSLDGYFAPASDATTGDLFHGDKTLQRAYTPSQTIHDQRSAALRFYLMVGDAEAQLKTQTHQFAGMVHAPDKVTVVDVPGGHNWSTWTGALPGALHWLAT